MLNSPNFSTRCPRNRITSEDVKNQSIFNRTSTSRNTAVILGEPALTDEM